MTSIESTPREREYREAVPASRGFAAALYAGVAAVLAGAVFVAATEDDSPLERGIGVVVLLLTAGVLVVVARWFLVLRVRVGGGEVEFRYGPLGKRVPAATIESVTVEPYRWLAYGGWGIRYTTRGRRAYSVPFVRHGVALQMRDGPRYHVASRDPRALREAIERMVATHGGDE